MKKIDFDLKTFLLLTLTLVTGCEYYHDTLAQVVSSGGHGQAHAEGHEAHSHKIIVTSAIEKDVILTQRYVCKLHSRRHIEVKGLEGGYLEAIPVSEGQTVTKGDLLFRIVPLLYQARLDADLAEADLVQIEFNNAKRLHEQNVVSQQEVALAKAKLDKALAKVKLAKAELDFASIRAPFDGLIDRLYCQQGSLVAEGDILTTLSDNNEMWVYFNVPEVRYLDYMNRGKEQDAKLKIELQLADHSIFSHAGHIGAIEADFNSETGNISFRADFPNPEGLLRHGQTGNILINRMIPKATVIPQRATFEILAKRYVYVVDDEHILHQREISIIAEQDDIFILGDGLKTGERFILEGVRQVRDGEKIDFDMVDSNVILGQLKNKAE